MSPSSRSWSSHVLSACTRDLPYIGEGVAFEPQLLLFEFLSGMMLRKQQVSLLGTFLAAHERRAPLCHQMLMGAGKTTVLAPLLTLLLAQPGVLVMECVPTSLLHFSRHLPMY